MSPQKADSKTASILFGLGHRWPELPESFAASAGGTASSIEPAPEKVMQAGYRRGPTLDPSGRGPGVPQV